jgi:Uma2 family endonuclease
VLDPQQIAPETLRPLRRLEYERLVSTGAFEDERLELLYGVIVRIGPHGPAHDAPLDRLTELFVRALGERAKVRVQSAFVAGDASEPEPDLAVVPRREYDEEHPSQAFLIVEVAESSLKKDRGVKARLYAESEVPEYWVVAVAEKVVEVHTMPTQGTYSSIRVYRVDERIRLQQFGDIEVSVQDILRR